MATLTKKELQQALKPLASKKDLEPIQTLLRQNTAILRQTTALMTHLVEDVSELKTDMKGVKTTLEDHTTTLDSIYKNTEHWKTEAAALRMALQRQKQWIAQIADKVHVKLEGLEQ